MTLWRIKNGLPSLADGLLVIGGIPGAVFIPVRALDPLLDYFEPRGLPYLGYAILFVMLFGLGGLGLLVFLRNQRKLRPKIRAPRVVFAFTVPPLAFLSHSLALSWLFPHVLGQK